MTLDLNHDEARYLRLKLRAAIAGLELAGLPLPINHEGQRAFLRALLDKLTKEKTS